MAYRVLQVDSEMILAMISESSFVNPVSMLFFHFLSN